MGTAIICIAIVIGAWQVHFGLGLVAFLLLAPGIGEILLKDDAEQYMRRFRRMSPDERAVEHRRRMGYE